VVEEYLANTVMTSCIAKKMQGGKSLILKEGWILDEGGGRFQVA
jgi:hypothetical protein